MKDPREIAREAMGVTLAEDTLKEGVVIWFINSQGN